MSKNITSEAVAKQLLKDPFTSQTKISQLADPIADTPVELTLDQLKSYEHNPRKSINPRFQEIKESIRQRGLDHPPTVTRRPGQRHYIIRSGGNTRLEVLKQLYEETGDERFYRIKCLFKPWDSEISTLVGHLAENELRGELRFIDKAIAINNMREFYHKELKTNKAPSLRELADLLKKDGYPISFSLIGKMLDCVNHLLPSIPDLLYNGLGKPRIEELLAFKNIVKKIWDKYLQYDDTAPDEDLFPDFFSSSLSKFNDIEVEQFNLVRVKDEVLHDLIFYTQQSYAALELDLLEFSKTSKSPIQEPEPITQSIEPSVANHIDNSSVSSSSPTTINMESLDNHHDIQSVSEIKESEITEDIQDINLPSDSQSDESNEEPDPQKHIVEPVSLTPKVQKINQDLDKQLGGEPIEFNEASARAIPVQAGGGLAEVVDVWYIAKPLDSIDSLRNELYQLAYDIACYGNYQDNLTQTNEGLGFGIKQQTTVNKNEHTEAIAMLMMTLLRVHPDQAQADIALAIFNQLLMGGYDIDIGKNQAKSIGIKPLPDVLLIKLFRFIRLARRLVELLCTE